MSRITFHGERDERRHLTLWLVLALVTLLAFAMLRSCDPTDALAGGGGCPGEGDHRRG